MRLLFFFGINEESLGEGRVGFKFCSRGTTGVCTFAAWPFRLSLSF
jgi:hypothetical protein